MRKVWRCRGGHGLGLVVWRGGVSNLLLFRQAIELAGEEGEDWEPPEVIAIVVGRVVDVRCSICGRLRTWVERK